MQGKTMRMPTCPSCNNPLSIWGKLYLYSGARTRCEHCTAILQRDPEMPPLRAKALGYIFGFVGGLIIWKVISAFIPLGAWSSAVMIIVDTLTIVTINVVFFTE